MDRLTVAMAVSRGRRLYHGQPFVVFALDLRDPLGLLLARLLHEMGDARSIEWVQRRAEERDRAPVVVVPSPAEDVDELMHHLDGKRDRHLSEGCTPGDLDAVRAFLRFGRNWSGSVPVFLAADQERGVFRFPLDRRAGPPELCPIAPLLLLQSHDIDAADIHAAVCSADPGIIEDDDIAGGGAPSPDAGPGSS